MSASPLRLVAGVMIGWCFTCHVEPATAQWPGIDPAWSLGSAAKWHRWTDSANTLPTAMRKQASQLLAQRRSTVSGLKSESDWERRSAEVREKFSQIFDYSSQAEQPDRRTPLNARITKYAWRHHHIVAPPSRLDAFASPPTPTCAEWPAVVHVSSGALCTQL